MYTCNYCDSYAEIVFVKFKRTCISNCKHYSGPYMHTVIWTLKCLKKLPTFWEKKKKKKKRSLIFGQKGLNIIFNTKLCFKVLIIS